MVNVLAGQPPKSGSNMSGMSDVTMQAAGFAARDGCPISGHWYVPADEQPKSVAVVACGGGIPARTYQAMARYLASKGTAILTFDYRGIGDSRHGSLRGFEAGIDHWGVQDLGAALTFAREAYPDASLGVVAHSIGTLLVGAAPDANRIARLVFLAPHTGYWRDYLDRSRWVLFLTWHILMPFVTKNVGYFPGRALGLGEDLPKGFAMDWARRRQPEFLVTVHDRDRFEKTLASYGRVTCPTLVLATTDDAFAPPNAGYRLLRNYPSLMPEFVVVAPADIGRRRLGHFAFIRRATGEHFWNRISAWLLHTSQDGTASPPDVSDTVPPSGTKDDLSAGSATL